MKENKYDKQSFFDKYLQMNRSIYGLDGAGEWHELKKLLPDFKNKKVLDLGCGLGWHCKYACKHEAKYVLGIDLSKKMLAKAKEINNDPRIEYCNQAIENVQLPKASFDIILSSLAFHYIEDYQKLISNIYDWLKPGGDLVFSVEHPVFTSEGKQDWYYDENQEIMHFPVDNYYYEGKREAIFLNEPVTKYHRTLTTYLQTLLQAGFVLTNIVEPKPPAEMMDLPGMQDELRRPMMLLISAKKA